MEFTGKFIVVEGIDGSGKTTLANAISTYLQDAGIKVMQAREPGGTPQGEQVRDLFKNPEFFNKLNTTDKVLLMNLSRSFLLKEIGKFRLNNPDGWVVLDRHNWTTYAYQGAEGADIFWMDDLDGEVRYAAAEAAIAESGLTNSMDIPPSLVNPDFYFYLDIPVEVAKQRIQSNRNGNLSDQYDLQSLDFFKKVQTIFQKEVRLQYQNTLVLNATRSLEINLGETLLYLRNKKCFP